MNVDVWSSSYLDPQWSRGMHGFILVHFTWSRDLYQSAAVTFTVYAYAYVL